MKVITGSSHPSLAQGLVKLLAADLVKIKIGKFANDEKRLQIMEDLTNEEVTLIQSFSPPVDEHIIELLFIADAAQRAGAKKITAIIPWYGYSLQDRIFNRGEALSAAVIAKLISTSPINQILLLDLHHPHIIDYFSKKIYHLSALALFKTTILNKYKLKDIVTVSPDIGGLPRATALAQSLDVEMIKIKKKRHANTNEIEQMELEGSIKNKIGLIIDDVIVSGGTVIKAAEILKKAGAKEIHLFATHGLLINNAEKKLINSQLDSVTITNSIHFPHLPQKIQVIDCAPLFASQLKFQA